MKIDIDQLTEAELVDLNHRIVARLKFLHQMRAHAAMLDFSLGERVCFQPRGQALVSGVIVKYNQKTVTVVTPDGHQWNVAPTLLSKVVEPSGEVAITAGSGR